MSATRLRFLVQGSQEDPYEVTFVRRGIGNLSAYCTCRAGQVGRYCKHRVRLLIGDTTDLVSDNPDEAELLEPWLRGSDIEDAMDAVREAEAAVKAAKKRLRVARDRVARAMRD